MNEAKDNPEKKNIVGKGSESEIGRGLMAFEDLDRWFDDMLSRRWMNPFDVKFPRFPQVGFPSGIESPKVDIVANDNEIKIHAALPGVKKEDLEVSLTGQSITIKSSTRHEEKKEEGQFYRREISRGEFQRTLPLPAQVDADNAKAKFQDGILEIVVPKMEKTSRKSIEIQ